MGNTTEISSDKFVRISWGAIVVICAFVFGVGGWAVSKEMTDKDQDLNIAIVKSKNELVLDKLDSVDKKVTRMETLMEYMYKQRGK